MMLSEDSQSFSDTPSLEQTVDSGPGSANMEVIVPELSQDTALSQEHAYRSAGALCVIVILNGYRKASNPADLGPKRRDTNMRIDYPFYKRCWKSVQPLQMWPLRRKAINQTLRT